MNGSDIHSCNDDLVRDLLTTIDRRDWQRLAGLVAENVCYDRPGYPTINGVDELLYFYRRTRVIADGSHRLESLLTNDTQGFCWGTFDGTSRSGEPLSEVFADWYEFEAGRVRRRRSFFFRPAI